MQQSGVYIDPVGSPSGRCNNVVQTKAALETSKQVVRVRTGNLTVRPLVAARVRTKSEPSRQLNSAGPDAKRDRPDTSH
jgi:hypothetical protein